MDEVRVLVEAEVNPTETDEKVKTAVVNMFGNIAMAIVPSQIGSVLTAQAQGLDALLNFRDLLRRDRVRAAARKVLFTRLEGNRILFFLNKQVAFANHVSFSQETGESPLGPIKVTLDCESPRELIDWLAPRTS
jgi:predicted RNA binding protein with dsRBD fold (UPF0201 family)